MVAAAHCRHLGRRDTAGYRALSRRQSPLRRAPLRPPLAAHRALLAPPQQRRATPPARRAVRRQRPPRVRRRQDRRTAGHYHALPAPPPGRVLLRGRSRTERTEHGSRLGRGGVLAVAWALAQLQAEHGTEFAQQDGACAPWAECSRQPGTRRCSSQKLRPGTAAVLGSCRPGRAEVISALLVNYMLFVMFATFAS